MRSVWVVQKKAFQFARLNRIWENRAMPGILGTNAALITDINLLIQIVAFVLVLIGLGYKTKGKIPGIALFSQIRFNHAN